MKDGNSAAAPMTCDEASCAKKCSGGYRVVYSQAFGDSVCESHPPFGDVCVCKSPPLPDFVPDYTTTFAEYDSYNNY
nr:hypothetical protein Iba_chr09eCG5480 [Ipomoea batatas]